MESLPAILVENASARDAIGICTDPTPIGDMENPDLASVNEIMGCSGRLETCIIHGELQKKRPRWSYIDNMETLNKVKTL